MITTELFAHIHNDPYLRGTKKLEGQLFTNTIHYMTEILQRLEHLLPRDHALQPWLLPLSDSLFQLEQDLLKQESLNQKLTQKKIHEAESHPAMQAYTQEWARKIMTLSSQDSSQPQDLLMAGGWSSAGDEGHAMMYQFSRDDHGDVLFKIYNSGEGLTYHEKHQSEDKTRYAPIKVYRIPQKELNEKKLAGFIAELLKPNLSLQDQPNIGAKALYTQFLSQVAYFNAIEEPAFKHTRLDSVTAGQHSGTCSEKVLHQLVETALPNKHLYQTFMYAFKKESLQDYIRTMEKQGALQTPIVRHQIELALANMARLLLKGDVFDDATRKQESDFLLIMQNKLLPQTAPQHDDYFLEALNEVASSKLDNTHELTLPTPVLPEAVEDALLDLKRPYLQPSLEFNYKSEDLLDDLDSFLEDVKDLQMNDPQAAYESLQNFFVDFPLPPSEAFRHLNEQFKQDDSERLAMLEVLSTLNARYRDLQMQLHCDYNHPNFIVGQLSVITLLSSLVETDATQTPMLDLVRLAYSDHTQKLRALAGFTTEEPKLDRRLHEIVTQLMPSEEQKKSFLNINYLINKRLKKHYREIMNDHHLFDILQSYYSRFCQEKDLASHELLKDDNSKTDKSLFVMSYYLKSTPDERDTFIKDLAEFKGLTKAQTFQLKKDLKAAVITFESQMRIESCISDSLSSIHLGGKKRTAEAPIAFQKMDFILKLSHPIIKNLDKPLLIPKSLNLEKDSLIQTMLNTDPQINSKHMGKDLLALCDENQDIYWARELAQLRGHEYQIVDTIDFFSRHLGLLDSPEIQLFLERNFLSPWHIHESMTKSPETIRKMQGFADMAFERFQELALDSAPELFFVKLKVKLSLYEIESLRSTLGDASLSEEQLKASTERLERLSSVLNNEIQRIKHLRASYQDANALYMLACTETLILSERLQNETQTHESTQLPGLINSLLSMRYHQPTDVVNPREQAVLEKGFRVLSGAIEHLSRTNVIATDELIIEAVRSFVNTLDPNLKDGIDSGRLKFELDFPTMVFYQKEEDERQDVWQINLSSGVVSKAGLSPGWLPDQVVRMPVFKRWFSHASLSVLMDFNMTHFEFVHNQVCYRILLDGHDYVLQKAFTLPSGATAWYQAHSVLDLELPVPLKEDKNQAWVLVNQKETDDEAYDLLITQGQDPTPIYGYQSSQQKLVSLEHGGKELLKPGSELHNAFNGFEHPDYTLITQTDTGYRIEFLRYGLTLTAVAALEVDEPQGWDFYLEGTSFKLQGLPANPTIAGFKSALVFQSGEEQKVIMPRQRYVVLEDIEHSVEKTGTARKSAQADDTISLHRTVVASPLERFSKPPPFIAPPQKGEETSEYYTFVPDTAATILKNRAYIEKHEAHLSQTESISEFSLSEQALQPKTQVDGLYGAYAYLCSHQPEKAIELLVRCEQNFYALNGTPEEIEVLKWIVMEVPSLLEGSPLKAELHTPEAIAVKLKALKLLAQAVGDPSSYHEAPIKIEDPLDYYEAFQNQLRAERQAFVRQLRTNISHLFDQYLHVQNNLKVGLKLSPEDQLTLLRAVFSDRNNQPAGPVGRQWRELEVRNLHMQLEALESQARQVSRAPESLKNDIQKVKERLAKSKTVARETSRLEMMPIYVDLPKQSVIKMATPLFRNSKDINKAAQSVALPLTEAFIQEVMSYPLNHDRLLVSFPHIIDFMIEHDISKNLQASLKIFCEQTIRALDASQDGSYYTNTKSITQYLYLFLNQRDAFLENQQKDSGASWEAKEKYKPFSEIQDVDRWFNNLHRAFLQLPTRRLRIKPIPYEADSPLEPDTILTDTQILYERLKSQHASREPVVLKPLSIPYSVEATLRQSSRVDLMAFYDRMEHLDSSFKQAFESAQADYYSLNPNLDFEERQKAVQALDERVGQLRLEQDQEKRQLGLTLLSSRKQRQALMKECHINRITLDRMLVKELDSLLAWANQAFKNEPETASLVDLQLQLLGQQKQPIQLQDCLRLAVYNDLNQTMAETGLSESDAHALHQKIMHYCGLSIEHQHWKRLSNALEGLPQNEETFNNQSDMQTLHSVQHIVELLNESNLIPLDASPALTVFQYDQNLLIRPSQYETLESLLKAAPETGQVDDKMIQLIMGGGKSKVLLPILAFSKAHGDNCPIIEVPEALYQSNLADLNRISLRLFGRHADGFQFDRQSPCDSLSLKKLYRQMLHTSVHRGFMVTTKESMASLDLKYHELLSAPGESKGVEWEKQIKWLERILNFRRHHADLIIDEVDSALDIRKQINYTIGGQETVPIEHRGAALSLFKFMSEIPYESSTLLDALLNTDTLSQDKLDILMETLSKACVLKASSPIAALLPETMTDAAQKEMIDYLLSRTEQTPDCVINAPKEIQNNYFLLRGQLSQLMPHTFTLKLYEHYGPSQSTQKGPLQRLVTVPYAGNNEPRENSKDINHLKTINLTMQCTLTQGLSDESIMQIIKDIKHQATTELLENPQMTEIDDTNASQRLNEVLEAAGLDDKLSDIHLNDEAKISRLCQDLKRNKTFLLYALENHILPSMTMDQKVLTHTPINHLNGFRSKQGVTGTPWNWRSMHPDLSYDESTSLGTDGLTSARLLQKDKRSFTTQVHIVDSQELIHWIQKAVEKQKAPERFRAIIDIGATFRGVSNQEVAFAMAEYATEHNLKHGTDVRHVLYYDKDPSSGMDQLYAISVSDPLSPPVSLQGRTPLEIENLLQSNPNQCFTYYDQKHTFGADIKQDLQASALATVDAQTLEKDLYQGVMRMRGFGQGQTVDLVVSSDSASVFLNDQDSLNIATVLHATQKNQTAQLLSIHFTGAMAQMTNVIYKNLDERLLQEDLKAKEKAFKFRCFEPFFSQTLSEQMVQQYGKISTLEMTETVLKDLQNRLINQWLSVLTEANSPVDPDEIDHVRSELNRIVDKALTACSSHYHHAGVQLEQTAESKQEQEVELEQDQTLQLDVEFEYTPPAYRVRRHKDWIKSISLQELMNLEVRPTPSDTSTNSDEALVYFMPRMCLEPLAFYEDKEDYGTTPYDPALIRTNNFALTTTAEHSSDYYFPGVQKSVHTMVMIQHKGELKGLLVTPLEAKSIEAMIKNEPPVPPDYVWITNTSETLIAGHRPDTQLRHPNYDRLMQQCRYYNGDLQALLKSDLSGSWLMEGYQEKLKYFQKHLLPYRLVQPTTFLQLKQKAEQLEKAYRAILKEPEISITSSTFQNLSESRQSLQRFQTFCQSLTISHRIENASFETFFYFELFMAEVDSPLSALYLVSLDKDTLKAHLQNYLLNSLQKNSLQDWLTLLKCDMAQQTFLREALLQGMTDGLTNPVLFKKILTQESPEQLIKLFGLLTPTNRQNLLESLSEEDIGLLFEQPSSVVKAFFDQLGSSALNERTPRLTGFKKTNDLKPLLSEPEKWAIVKKHANELYMKRFWIGERETDLWFSQTHDKSSCALNDLMQLRCQDPDNSEQAAIFNTMIKLLEPLSVEFQIDLILSAEHAIDTAKSLKSNPYHWISPYIGEEAFIRFVGDGYFIARDIRDGKHEICDLLYSKLSKMTSDEKVRDLLFSCLPGQYVLESIENKTEAVQGLMDLNQSLNLIKWAENAAQVRPDVLVSGIQHYSVASSLRPQNYIPLSRLRVNRHDPNSRLVKDVLRETKNPEVLEALEHALALETKTLKKKSSATLPLSQFKNQKEKDRRPVQSSDDEKDKKRSKSKPMKDQS